MTGEDDSGPWGPIQTCRTIAPGARRVLTASHGGLFLPANFNARSPAQQLRAATRALRHPGNHRYGWAFRRSAFRPGIRPLDYPKRLEQDAIQSPLFA